MLTDNRGPDSSNAYTFAPAASILGGATMTLCKGWEGSFQFGISGDDTITLWDATRVVVDSTTLIEKESEIDKVWQRNDSDDPLGKWSYIPLKNETMLPVSAAKKADIAVISDIVLVAIADKGSSEECDDQDWIAIQNNGIKEVSLFRYMLTDGDGRQSNDAFTFAPTNSLAGGARITLCRDKIGSFTFGIGGDDTITLWDSESATALDSTTLAGKGEFDKVWSRNLSDNSWQYKTGKYYNAAQQIFEKPDPNFFADSVVPRITISLSRASWVSLARCARDDYLTDNPPIECQYHTATCQVRYGKFDKQVSCYVRRKGEGSWRGLSRKPGLKVKFVQEFNGIKKLTLNNGVQDKSNINDRLAYTMYRMGGVIAPRCNTAQVSLKIEGNADHFVQYTNIESVSDKRFLRAHFPGKKATLWDGRKARSWAKMGKVKYSLNQCRSADPRNTMECSEGCSDDPEVDITQLGKLVDVAGECEAGSVANKIWSQLNRTAFLQAMAMDRILGHWDSLCYDQFAQKKPGQLASVFGNNFYIYFDGAQFGVIPSSTDQVLNDKHHRNNWKYSCVQMLWCLNDKICKEEYDLIYSGYEELFRGKAEEMRAFVKLAASQAGTSDRYKTMLIKAVSGF
jgi:hypothetical protein